MSNIHQVYSKKSLMAFSLEKSKQKDKIQATKTKSKNIPIPTKNNTNYYCRVGINEVNEIDGISQKMRKQEKIHEDLRKIVSSETKMPPSNFTPNTPPEHNLIYKYIYNNDCSYFNQYNDYGIRKEIAGSL